MAELAHRRIEEQIIEPPVMDVLAGINPTQIRYGWTTFKDIWLPGPDGIPNPLVQPYEIAGADGRPVRNPFFTTLKKGHLIPFTTFEIMEQGPSPDIRMGDGRAALVSVTRTQTALDCVVLVARVHARNGFTILQSLQGVDQPTAQRIFKVVQPFNYPISTVVSELEFANDRIEATEPIVFRFAGEPDYVVPNLRDDHEREIARRLQTEMIAGAELAYTLASEQLNDTEMSMVNRFAGGKGKTGADPHDRYLCEELERELPAVIGEKKLDAGKLEQKVDFLVGKEVSREQSAEIERLRAENEQLRKSVPLTCGYPKIDGEPCQMRVTYEGDRCQAHAKKEAEAVAAATPETVTENAG
jgi:hypothetical protein